MPWKEATSMSLRAEFTHLAELENANISELCRRFGISRKTGYKWRKRYLEEGESGPPDRSRRPHHSPRRSPVEVEAAVMKVRREHPAWGDFVLLLFSQYRQLILGQTPNPFPVAIDK